MDSDKLLSDSLLPNTDESITNISKTGPVRYEATQHIDNINQLSEWEASQDKTKPYRIIFHGELAHE